MNNIPQEIPADYLVCKYRLSDECSKIAHKSNFVGFYCKNCKKLYTKQYYAKNQEKLSNKAQKRYVPTGNPMGRPWPKKVEITEE